MVSKVSCCCISLQGCLFPSSSYIFVILAIWHKVQLTTLQIPFFAHNFEDNEATSCVRWLQIVWHSIHNPPTCPSQPVTVRLSISICETIATEHLLRTQPKSLWQITISAIAVFGLQPAICKSLSWSHHSYHHHMASIIVTFMVVTKKCLQKKLLLLQTLTLVNKWS